MSDGSFGRAIEWACLPNESTVTGAPISRTRKLCYRKDDRAMRPIHGALKIFMTP